VTDIVARLVDLYNVDGKTCEDEVLAFLRRLDEKRLLSWGHSGGVAEAQTSRLRTVRAQMVDPKETNETAQPQVGDAPADRKVWVAPRLETSELGDTAATTVTPPPDGPSSIS
jgi:hypothetical protein